MPENVKWRGLFVLFCVVLSLIVLAPTLLRESTPGLISKAFDPIHLGLDLQGGMHLVLGVEVDKAVESRLDALIDETELSLTEKDVVFKRVERRQGDRITVIVYDAAAGTEVDTLMEADFPNLEAMTIAGEGGYIEKHYRLSDQEVASIKDYAIRQALETLRNRVDQFGVSEPVLQRQSDNRILIQLPGVEDQERAIALIGKTARLEFKMVAENASIEDAVMGKLAPGTQLLYERNVNPSSGAISETPIVVETKAALTGDLLADAQVRIDNQYNDPYVYIKFNAVGAKRFDQVTAATIGRRMAIVLDGSVYSAPFIRERISGGSAQISGSFSEQEATDLAIILRAGSLPAPVKILENRSVGPSLGKDSINKGILSIIVGGILVVLAMLVYYNVSGIVANIALILNVFFIMAMLSIFKATLTLPGIAGIVLTVGMAVDANVLIFERIREELRLGKSPKAALDAGFAKAFLTIIDANVTTLIAALVLFQFGTGAVKGFAVTLSIGIIASLFTAIFVTRVIFDLFMSRPGVKKMRI